MVVFGMLFLRALVPAGFMLESVDGRPAVVLCDLDMPPATAGAHHHHHPGADAAARHEGAHADPTCPYAQSAGSAPLPSLPLLAAAVTLHRLAAPAATTQTLLAFGPPRQQTSRGPPALA